MDITVTKRTAVTKGQRKQRLRQGFVPGTVYGKGIDPVLVEVPAKGVADVLLAASGQNTVITLNVEGDSRKHTVMMETLDRDPITRGFLNVGFHQIQRGDKVTAHIPITLIGTPASVTTGEALLEQMLDAITVHAQPTDLLPHLDVDVSGLGAGDVLRVADLPHNPKLEFTTGEDIAIAAVHYSTTAQQVEEAVTPVDEAPASGGDAVTELRADADAASDSVTGTASP